MEGACISIHTGDWKCLKNVNRKLEQKRPLERRRCRWEDDTKMDLGGTRCEAADWNKLA